MAELKSHRARVAKREQTVEVNDLTGGMNLRLSPTLLKPDQARSLVNWSLEEPGALVVRWGHERFGTANFGSGRAQGGQRVYLSSRRFTLVAHNSTIYSISESGTASTVYSTVSTNQVFFPYDRDLVAILDGSTGSTGLRKSTDGSSWTKFGIAAPSSKVATSTLSSGTCSSGEYEFAVSFKDRDLDYESNISPTSTIYLTGSTGAFHLVAGSTFANTGDLQIDAYVWYGRDITAGETVLRKISSGTASTFRVTDTNWTANEEAPVNHDVLLTGAFGVVWKNRWWIVDPNVGNRLHFSEIFLPQAFPALYYIDIPFEKGDSITAVVSLGDVLTVFGQSKPFLIIGQTSLDFEVKPSAGSIAGCLGPRAAAVLEQGIIHASAEGIHVFDGATDKLLSHDIEVAWRDYISHTAGSELAKTPLVYEARRKCLRVAVSRRYPSGLPGEWELNLDRSRGGDPAWAPTNRTIGGYIPHDGNEDAAGQRGELVTWSDTTGQLFKESTGTTYNSSNMQAEYEGPTLALGLHRALVNGLHVEYEPHSGALTSEMVVDEISQGGIALTIGSGLALYGTAVYGTATYGGSGRRKAYTEEPLSAEGRTAQVKLTYVGQERMKIYGYAVDLIPEPRVSLLGE